MKTDYTQVMIDIANDQSHGYSQASRWGPDYDCSSLVIHALDTCGIPATLNGATYTGNLYDALKRCGFTDVTKQVNLSTGSGLKRGDILCYHKSGNVGHTAVYAGDGKIVHARGQSYGSPATGDQGTEIAVTAYYNPPWQWVMRLTGETYHYSGRCRVECADLISGDFGPAVLALQALLSANGFKGADGKKLDLDGEFGPNTAYAVKAFQIAQGMKNINFGTVSKLTWSALLGTS